MAANGAVARWPESATFTAQALRNAFERCLPGVDLVFESADDSPIAARPGSLVLQFSDVRRRDCLPL